MHIIADRNILAHGELIIDVKTKKVKISFFNTNSLKNDFRELSPEFYKKLWENIVFVNEYCFNHMVFKAS